MLGTVQPTKRFVAAKTTRCIEFRHSAEFKIMKRLAAQDLTYRHFSTKLVFKTRLTAEEFMTIHG